MEKINKPLGQLLLEANLITEAQLNKALELQKSMDFRLGHTLINLGFITEEQLIKILEKQFGMPCIKINNKIINWQIIKLIPEYICRKYRLIPILLENNKLTIAATNPYDLSFIDEIEISTDFSIEVVLCSEKSVMEAIDMSFGKKQEKEISEYEKIAIKGKRFSLSKIIEFLILTAKKLNAKGIQLQEQHNDKFLILFITKDRVITNTPPTEWAFSDILIKIKSLSKLDQLEKSFQEGIFTFKREKIRVLIFPTPIGTTVELFLS